MNTRFAVATHILIFLAAQGGRPAPSELIAASVNTNASLIRRLLAQLGRAGLTTAQLGSGGGALMARPAARITLLDIYRAMDDAGGLFGLPAAGNPQCEVGRQMPALLTPRLQAAEAALYARLAATTVQDLHAEAQARRGGGA